MNKPHIEASGLRNAGRGTAHEYDTVFDHSQNSLVQTISERVKLVISLASSIGVIYLDGQPVEKLGVVTTHNWPAALDQATNISTQTV